MMATKIRTVCEPKEKIVSDAHIDSTFRAEDAWQWQTSAETTTAKQGSVLPAILAIA